LLVRVLFGALGAASCVGLLVAVRFSGRPALPVLGHITGFRLTNHLGAAVGAGDLAGRIWVADIIFTRCPGPCVQLTRQLAEVQAALPPARPVTLVSLTADPGFDTGRVLRQYAERFGAQPGRWHFLTGPKADLYDLAIRQLRLAVADTDPAQRANDADLFIHSTRFVLVDSRGDVRAVFEGTEPESHSRLLEAIGRLLAERPS
jgi:protein SCO1/2